MSVKQTERLLTITTPLGSDVLLLESFQGQESLSGLFQCTLHLISKQPSVSFAGIVGKRVTIKIEDEQGSRYINGFVSRFSQGARFAHTAVGQGKEYYTRYHASIVPWLWNLTQTSDCRVFQNKSVPDIIKQIFSDLGFSDFKLMLKGSYEPRVFCVQYRETDFDFVSRLMEDEGIFYFFEHSQDKHTMVLGDSPSAHQNCPGQSSLPYNAAGGPQGGSSVSGWVWQQSVRSGAYSINDYNFETPSTALDVKTPTKVTVGKNEKLEMYDYEGKYLQRSGGERYVKIRMEEQEAAHTEINGASDCYSLNAGCAFTLKDHYRGDYNDSYVLTSVVHQARNNLLDGEDASSYSNSFSCIPKKVPFRPSRSTRKPVIQGTQTALVVGKQGEEIWTDKYARIKVQFHWDREGKKDENSSCWVRVAQTWAGKQWGALSIPRIGQEVVVAFLEGDPDQPIIVGSVYNAEQMPPYSLPTNQTQSGLKTHSSKGGGPAPNEIRFEDKAGSEEVFVNGQKDYKRVVKNKDELEIQEGDRSIKIKMGNETTKLDMGKAETEAMQSIEFKVGESSIKIDQMGVTIKGMKISVEGQVLTEVKGLMTQVNASAILTVKGAITMIG